METCPACKGPCKPSLRTSRLSLQKCRRCGTFLAGHPAGSSNPEPWQSAGVTPEFLSALAERRSIQSHLILRRYRTLFESGPTLDYGCGQGAFIADLLREGLEAVGCDVSKAVTGAIARDRFIGLAEPWSLPEGIEFKNVVLLDVLEHNPEPEAFLGRLKDRGVRHFLVKVPLAGGPVFLAAMAVARLGATDAVEKLFLAGDVSPHRLYFSSGGLVRLFERLGFRCASRLSLAEIGQELPRRIRLIPSWWKTAAPFLAGAGLAAEWVSPIWPDTGVFHFERAS